LASGVRGIEDVVEPRGQGMNVLPVEWRDKVRVELVKGQVREAVPFVLQLLELLNAGPHRRQVPGQLAKEADSLDDVGGGLVEKGDEVLGLGEEPAHALPPRPCRQVGRKRCPRGCGDGPQGA
jgi:hypothetical protein